jgi:hypothetical protein
VDVLFFLKGRTKFIRSFYDQASAPFLETKRKIEAREEPFDDPPYDESGEPPYLEQWQDADEALEFLGQACLSHVASSLKLYLDEVRRELEHRFRLPAEIRAFSSEEAKQRGPFHANKSWFAQLGIRFEDSDADLKLLEEILVTRNRVQHPSWIGFHMIRQTRTDREKFPIPTFASDFDLRLYTAEDATIDKPGPWTLAIRKETLFEAIEEVESFCEWLEGRWQPSWNTVRPR